MKNSLLSMSNTLGINSPLEMYVSLHQLHMKLRHLTFRSLKITKKNTARQQQKKSVGRGMTVKSLSIFEAWQEQVSSGSVWVEDWQTDAIYLETSYYYPRMPYDKARVHRTVTQCILFLLEAVCHFPCCFRQNYSSKKVTF